MNCDILKAVFKYASTVEPSFIEDLGTLKITLLCQVSCYIKVKKQRNIKSWDQQNIQPLYNEVPLYFGISYLVHIMCILLNAS